MYFSCLLDRTRMMKRVNLFAPHWRRQNNYTGCQTKWRRLWIRNYHEHIVKQWPLDGVLSHFKVVYISAENYSLWRMFFYQNQTFIVIEISVYCQRHLRHLLGILLDDMVCYIHFIKVTAECICYAMSSDNIPNIHSPFKRMSDAVCLWWLMQVTASKNHSKDHFIKLITERKVVIIEWVIQHTDYCIPPCDVV